WAWWSRNGRSDPEPPHTLPAYYPSLPRAMGAERWLGEAGERFERPGGSRSAVRALPPECEALLAVQSHNDSAPMNDFPDGRSPPEQAPELNPMAGRQQSRHPPGDHRSPEH